MLRLVFIALVSVLSLTPALAHTGAGEAVGLAHGLMHPMSGLDHVLAMVAVGLLAAFLGGRAVWLVPASFVAMMAVGAGLGAAGLGVPFVEIGIALSVVVLGVAVALRRSMPLAFAMSLAGAFAVVHGQAHGAEMPEAASALAYGAGFVLATGLLHVAGIGLGLSIARLSETYGRRIAQVTGSAMALAGVALLAG